MRNPKNIHPRLVSPLDFWSTYFNHAVSVTPSHQLPASSRALLALDEVFGNLITNCLAQINENRIRIEYLGCPYIDNSYPPACDAHMGALLGLLETTHKKSFSISKDTKGKRCHILLESTDD
jgi:hypothetical protein